MIEDRFAVLCLPRKTMTEILHKVIHVVNFPDDCIIEAMTVDSISDVIGLRLWSSTFRLTNTAAPLPTFNAKFEKIIPPATNDPEFRS